MGNEEIVRGWAEGVRKGELALELMTEDVWMENVRKFPVTGPYEGHDGIRKWWRELTEVFSEVSFVIHDVTEVEDGVVLTTQRIVGRFAATGIPVDAPWASIFWLRDGLIYRVTGHTSRDGALRALDAEDV